MALEFHFSVIYVFFLLYSVDETTRCPGGRRKSVAASLTEKSQKREGKSGNMADQSYENPRPPANI